MSNKIKPKRSYTANAVPTTSDLDTNELAINWADGKAFTKDASGNIVSVTLGGSGGGAVDDARWDYFKPAAPTGVTATATNAQAVVSWTAPAIVVPPVTDYSVQFSTNGGSTWTTATDAVSAATSATITGLTNRTAYIFRVAATNGIGTGAYSTASAAVTPTAGDALFASVSLLLPFNDTFADSGPNNVSLAASAANASISTSVSKWGSGSGFFSGTNGRLSGSNSSLFQFGTGDFSVEAWVQITAAGSFQTLFTTRSSSTGDDGSAFWFGLNTGSLKPIVYTSGLVASSSVNLTANQWHFVCVTRSSGTLRIYIDGTQTATASDSTNYTVGFPTLGYTLANQYPLNGYIDDLRITVGSARGYTGSTIPVPVEAFPTRGIYEDPFFESVSLLLPMDGTGSTFADSSLTPKTITASGNATQSTTQSKFGGKSLALDGGSAIRIPSNAAFGFGTGDFTVEFFLYYTGASGYVFFVVMNPGSGPYLGYGLNAGTKRPWLWNDGNVLIGNKDVTNNVWQHHAYVRNGGVLTIYLDGVAIGSTAFATDLGSSVPVNIGDNGIGSQHTNGFIDSLRITKGHARYTANFTPPTAAFPTS